jgi:hypothetical protein
MYLPVETLAGRYRKIAARDEVAVGPQEKRRSSVWQRS